VVKERITVSIDKKLLKWLDEQIKLRKFANRSHGLEFLIKRAIDLEGGAKRRGKVLGGHGSEMEVKM